MGTDDLNESLNYSMMVNAILKYMKDAENRSSLHKMTGLQKKDFVLEMAKNIPNVYEHSQLISVMIDSFIQVSNNPSIIMADRPIFLCCGC